MDSLGSINIKVVGSGREVFFKIKTTTPMKKLMDAWSAKTNNSPQTCRFLLMGLR